MSEAAVGAAVSCAASTPPNVPVAINATATRMPKRLIYISFSCCGLDVGLKG
jgi:hypothetical protein